MRLFFGLSLSAAVREEAERCARLLQEGVPGRYADPDNYHITLAFLGDVPEERLDKACAVLERCVRAHPAPLITLDGVSHFGREQNAILILRAKSDPPLDALHEALVSALREAGLPADDGPFSPHVTLARHAVMSSALPACEPVSQRSSRAHLYLSARDADHILRYTPLFSVPFAENGF